MHIFQPWVVNTALSILIIMQTYLQDLILIFAFKMGKTLLQMTYFASWALISEALLQHFIKLSAYIIIKAK